MASTRHAYGCFLPILYIHGLVCQDILDKAKKTNQEPAFGLNRSADPKSLLERSLPSVDGRAWIPCGSKVAHSQTSMLWEVTQVSFGMGFCYGVQAHLDLSG